MSALPCLAWLAWLGCWTNQVVVIGGGWAGFGAASHLASAGVKVTLLEAQSSAGGLAAGWETAKGKK